MEGSGIHRGGLVFPAEPGTAEYLLERAADLAAGLEGGAARAAPCPGFPMRPFVNTPSE